MTRCTGSCRNDAFEMRENRLPTLTACCACAWLRWNVSYSSRVIVVIA